MKIAFIGPESSGKTTLAEILSEKYNAECVPEFSREYLKDIQTNYVYEDLELIAKGQLNSILKLKENKRKFIDTDLISMQVWSQFKYHKCCDFILNNIEKQQIDLYFLCKPDFPWKEDELRENPNDREELFELFVQILEENKLNFTIIEGNLENRIQVCEQIINQKLNHEKS